MSAPCPATRLDHPQDPVARERDRARGGPADWLRLAAAADLPTRHGRFRVFAFRDDRDGREHVALVRGDVAGRHDVPTRLHSECLTGDVMGSLRCDCRDQLEAALRDLGARDRGLLLYLRQEGRGIGLANKVRAYALQDAGLDTVDANLALGFREDERDYAVAAHMLAHLEVRSVRLMTNNPDKLEQLQRYGVRVSARIPHVAPANEHNRAYLRTKAARCGHRLELAGEGPERVAPRRGAQGRPAAHLGRRPRTVPTSYDEGKPSGEAAWLPQHLHHANRRHGAQRGELGAHRDGGGDARAIRPREADPGEERFRRRRQKVQRPQVP